MSTQQNADGLVLKSDVLGKFLLHQDQTIRLAALALLVTSHSTMKPITKVATDAVLQGLPSMHADCDAYGRGEIMSITRKFITRLKTGILTEDEVSKASQSVEAARASALSGSDTETKLFLEAYLGFIQHDLCVTASYPRHASALKALRLLLESGLDPRADIKLMKADAQTSWKIKLDVFTPRLLRLLVDLLLDSFEEVRNISLLIINLFPAEILLQSTGISIIHALDRAEKVASNTSRADHADAVARLYHILFSAAQQHGSSEATSSNWWSTKYSVVNTILARLEERVSSPKGLFSSTMQQAPLHGYMSGLR